MHARVLLVFASLVASSACASTPPTNDGADTVSEHSETEHAAVCGTEAPTGVQVGMCAPEFSLPDRNEVSFSLHAQRGKVALVDISAIW